jgi:simple sugar transport system permease protein
MALFLSLALHVWVFRTYWGFEARACGANPDAARVAGVPVAHWQRRLFVLSGALAGLAGALEVGAVDHRFYAAFSPGYGFDGITVAFLVNAIPGWLWLSSLLLASLRASDKWLQLSLGVSPKTILILEGVFLLSVACQTGRLSWSRRGRRNLAPSIGFRKNGEHVGTSEESE